MMSIGMKAMLASTALVAGLMLAAVTTEADAATVTLNSVTGKWTQSQPTVSGIGTSQINWGTSSGSGQSGYRFDGVAPPSEGPYNVDQEFTAGTFTHFNRPITGTTLEGARLEVDFAVTINNGAPQNLNLTSVFDFTHLETPNNANPCADGGANGSGVNVNGCADRVTFAVNPGLTEAFDIDGVLHVLTLTGFVIGGNTASEFWTTENATNTADIKGVLTAQSTIVPVPAALPLLLTALGALGVVGRKKMKAAA